jgi:hypothetical protein
VWRFLWREDGSVVYNCFWSSPGQSFSGPSPVELMAIFYCLRFDTSLFVASYESQGYGGVIRPRLHTGVPVIRVNSKSQSYVTTDGQSTSLSWNKAPIWAFPGPHLLDWTHLVRKTSSTILKTTYCPRTLR